MLMMGSGLGSLTSARVSPISTFSIPVTATMSPAVASFTLSRPKPEKEKISPILSLRFSPFLLSHATLLPECILPFEILPIPILPT